MSARITAAGIPERPRKTFETPVFVHQEYPEHVALCETVIRARRRGESAVRLRDGSWFNLAREQREIAQGRAA
jgi:hypothetical protein